MILIALQQPVNGLNSSVVEARICQENLVSTMAADALAPCVARTSAAMVLTT